MKSLLLVCCLLVLSAPAWGEQKLDVNIPGGGAQDLLNMTTIPSTISDHPPDYTMTRSCTNREGRVVHQGDPEFKHCIAVTERLKTAPAAKEPSTQGSPNVITIQEQEPPQ